MSKNKEKLNEAFSDISSNFIESTAKPPVRKKAVWVRLVAAVVCVAALISGIVAASIILNKRNKPIIEDPSQSYGDSESYLKYVLLAAEYPTMAKYPGKNQYDTPEYEAWRNDIRKRWEYNGAGDDLDEFFKTTITEFLSGHGENNAVYSPLNVYFALAMLAEITEGNSRQQVLDLLGVENIEALRTKTHAIWNANYMDEGTVKSILGSSVWLDEKYFFNKDTLNILKEYYYASSFEGNLGTNKMNSALQAWLNEQTGGLLEDQISEIELDPETIMALATTIYFNAKWSNEFYDGNTAKGIFHSSTGELECDFMNDKESGYYYWGEKFGAVGKSLENTGSMWFVLPDEGVSIDALLSDSEMLSFVCSSKTEWKKSKYININLSVPKFDIQSNMDLIDGLKNLGITDCFDIDKSDFSSITNSDIFLNQVKHGAGVKIDEEGVVKQFEFKNNAGATVSKVSVKGDAELILSRA